MKMKNKYLIILINLYINNLNAKRRSSTIDTRHSKSRYTTNIDLTLFT